MGGKRLAQRQIVRRALWLHHRGGIVGGLDLAAYYPELGNALLVCATETKTSADIDRYRSALSDTLQGVRAA